MSEYLYFANSNEWRYWLEQNHDTEREAWLVHYKKYTGKPGIQYEDAVEEALCFGWIDGLMRSMDSEKFILRYSPRRKKSIWSETNKKRVERLIEQGRITSAGMAVIEQAKQNGEWHKAESREKLEIPPELEKALAADDEAKRGFEGATPSRQKQLIYWVDTAKKQETRLKRVKEILQMVKGDSENPGR